MICAVIDTNVLVAAAKQHRPGHKLRTDNAFYILKYTYAACVLTENGFMDSPLSLAFLDPTKAKKPSSPSTWTAS